MIEFFYKILTTIGYTHPIHAPTTHIPVGMVIGAFIFAIVSWKFRKDNLARTAHHCMTLALLALLPTVIVGIMDWQHYYAGAWLFPIKMKLALAALLLILLVFALSAGYRAEAISKSALVLYGLCLLNVTALGYLGGELVFGKTSPRKAVEVVGSAVSSEQFATSCGSCHPGGGNTIKANLPLRSAPQLSDFNSFLTYIRSPKARDGSQTIMPSFPAEKLSDNQAREIYQYVTHVLSEH